MPPFPRLTTLPKFTDLLIDCRSVIAAAASQKSPPAPLTDDEMNKTPEQYFAADSDTTWIMSFKGKVIPQLHNDAKYAKYFKKFPYSDAFARKAFKTTFNDMSVDIAMKVFVPLEDTEGTVGAWLDV